MLTPAQRIKAAKTIKAYRKSIARYRTDPTASQFQRSQNEYLKKAYNDMLAGALDMLEELKGR